MLWGAGSVADESLHAPAADRRSGRARYLLGFNEPDSRSHATAVPDDGWLPSFMSIARAHRLRVDFVALRFYRDFTDPSAVTELRDELISLHRRYGEPKGLRAARTARRSMATASSPDAVASTPRRAGR